MKKTSFVVIFVFAFLFGIFTVQEIISMDFFRFFIICICVMGFLFELNKIFHESIYRIFSVFCFAFVLGILRCLMFSNINVLDVDNEFFLFKFLNNFKALFEERLMQIYPEPYGNFMAGLLTGSRAGIDSELMEKFRQTGLTHIIAISGYNISIIIVLVSGILGFLKRQTRVIFSIVFVILFTVFVGASASVVRASIMGIISLLALKYGRQYYAGISLIIAAFLMCMFSPNMLINDLGFQLSVLATFGIISVSSLIKKYMEFLPDFFLLRETLIMSLSAQVFVLPWIIFKFGYFNFLSPVINVFVLPFIPYAMLFGFLSVIISFFSMLIGDIVGFFGYLSLKMVIFFVDMFSYVKIFTVETYFFSWVFLLFYFFVFFKLYKSKLC